MIQRIYEIPDRFRIDNCVIGRIDGYFRAYGSDYDFCRFYSGENSLIMNYDGEHFVYTDENCDKDELMFFLMADGLNCATVNENAYKLMKDDLSGFACQKLYLMTKENINASQAAKEVAVTDN